MSQLTNIVVKDNAITPNVVTLIPIGSNPIQYRGSAAGVPVEGQPRLTLSVEKLKNGSYKVTAKLEVPVMETLGASGTSAGYVAPPKVAYIIPIIITMFADKRSTIKDRENVLKLAAQLITGGSLTANTSFLFAATNADTVDWNTYFETVDSTVGKLFTNLVSPT